MPNKTINIRWVNNKFIRTYLNDDCICVNGEINVKNLPNTKEEDAILEAMSYFSVYPSAKDVKCVNLSLNGENIKILPNYTLDDVLTIYNIKKTEHTKAEMLIQKRIKAYFNKESIKDATPQNNQNIDVNPPVYFLYTNTRSTEGYSSSIVDYPMDDKHNYNRIVNDVISNIFNNLGRQPFYEFDIEDLKVICYCFDDCRTDGFARKISTYLGVLIDKNDLNFNVEEFKRKIGKPQFSKNYSIFDLIKEKNIPIKFSSKFDINLERS